MAENSRGATKKIVVRKLSSTDDKIRNYDDEYFIPLAAHDSEWNGIFFELPSGNVNELDGRRTTETETEIKVIDLERVKETPPLLILFPDLKNQRSDCEHMALDSLSSTDLTKMLKGKKPNFKLIRAAKRLNKQITLSAVREESSESSENLLTKQKPAKPNVHSNSRDNAYDADVSDTSSNQT